VTPESVDKIKVLIIDDIGETRENLRKLLSFEPGLDVVGAAAGGTEGVKLAQELEPHVVLMDINMPDMDGITATKELLQKVPTAQVVMLSVQGETGQRGRAGQYNPARLRDGQDPVGRTADSPTPGLHKQPHREEKTTANRRSCCCLRP
jgi:chemotaxis response regulator CheB